jgi:curved DNA-binding protein CbpA
MSAFSAALGPDLLAVEVLVHVARARLSGRLSLTQSAPVSTLLFRDGRPEGGQGPEGVAATRLAVVALVRHLAAQEAGTVTFTEEAPPPATHGIDTLGEVLLAVMASVPPTTLTAAGSARGACKLAAQPTFAKVAGAVAQVGGPKLAAPGAGTLAQALEPAPLAVQRALWAQVVLGGLKLEGFTAKLAKPAAPVPAAAAVAGGPAPLSEQARAVATAFHAAAGQDHYAFLGVARDAPVDVIRKAYFEQAKRWHADSLVGARLDDVSKGQAAELFRRADEAQRVLTSPEERKTYDWVLERQAQGLPTDPKVVMEAEGLFRRGETLVRRGQVAQAEPLLKQAITLNKGEAEYWAYHGFALYGAKGAEAVAEARAELQKCIAMNAKLDAPHEFLGRLAHSEGEHGAAKKHLLKAIELNPKNTHAERELRLLNMRQEQAGKPAKTGLLDKLLKR